MKIKKINKETEKTQKNFKFVTLNKIEMYSPKMTVRNVLLRKKDDNKFKFPQLSSRKSYSLKKSNNKAKTNDIYSMSTNNVSEDLQSHVNNKLNSLLNESELPKSQFYTGSNNENSFSIIDATNEESNDKKVYPIDIKKRILDVYEHKLIGNRENDLDDLEKSIIERYKRFSPNDYFNKVSNKVFTILLNSNGENSARLNFKNFKVYKPHKMNFDNLENNDFEKINLGRNYHEVKRQKLINKYNAINDKNLKSNINFYEKLPYIEDQVKKTIDRLHETKENYSRLKNIYFGYN